MEESNLARSSLDEPKNPRLRGREPSASGGPAAAPPDDPPDPRGEETGWDRTRANLKTIGGAVLLALFIRIAIFEPFEIEGPSMQPTLLNGDRVVVAKYLYGLFLPYQNEALVTWGSPQPGDVVIVRGPNDNVDIVKRVIGVAGDTIEIDDNTIVRNGQPITRTELGDCPDAYKEPNDPTACEWLGEHLGEHDYKTSQMAFDEMQPVPPTTVPEGHVYVMGDHRDRSNDSRRFGPVSVARVKGKALVVYWSNGDDKPRWDRLGKPID
jgi:signal peptidase I